MKISILSLILLSFLCLSGCGQDDDDNSSTAQNSPRQPQEEQAPAPDRNEDNNDDEEEPNPQIQYSTVELSSDSFFGIFTHEIRMDLNRRPVIITGNFQSFPEIPEDETRSCSFQMSATEKQADKIERLADKLKTCVYETEDDIIADGDSNFITLTKTDGSTITAQKYSEGEDDTIYLCRGRKQFYSYVRTVIKDKVDRPDCPENALTSIFE